MQRSLLRAAPLFFSAFFAAFVGASWAAQRPPIDALGEMPIATNSGARSKALSRPDLVGSMHVEERLDLPTFVWLKADPSASRAKALGLLLPEEAARSQLREIADLYRMSPAEIDAAPLHHVERLLDNGYLVRFTNQRDGVEVFRESAGVVLDESLQVVAVGGYLGQNIQAKSLAKAAYKPFALTAADAIAVAMGDYGFLPSVASLLSPVGSKSALARSAKASKVATSAPYQYYSARGMLSPTGAYLSVPARAKAVWYRMPDGLVPAYYVETQMYDPAVSDVEFYGYVIAADDGRMLFRHHQQEDAAFTYKTYAETGGINLPFPGPQGRGASPHPTGNNDGFQASFVPQNDVTLQNGPISTNDPWLAPGATRTIGNNVEAWANLFGPAPVPPATDPQDGTFNPDPQECNMAAPITGDIHACVSAPGVFSYVFDPLSPAQATKVQSVAATVNLFYMNNWLHDWYYDAGFKEIDGNAQDDNYGRGGLASDSIRAQAQDYSGTDNANMSTPADGARPRMRMYVFNGLAAAALGVNSPPAIAGEYAVGISTSFGPAVYDLTSDVVQALDAADAAGPSTTDGCSAITNAGAVAGKIAIIDRGTCGFVVKVKNAQNAGAIGVIIANLSTSAFGNMGGTDATITIPAVEVTFATGGSIKANLASPVNVHMRRIFGIKRDGTVDNQIVAHEWGHYISNRLVGNASGLTTNMARGLGEGWADFHAMLMTVKAEDALVAANANFNGVYGLAGYVTDGPQIVGVTQSTGYYNGIRRYPYSSNTAKNPLTYKHITTGVALPVSPPPAFTGDNAEVHNTGEIWSQMLWQCYSALLRDTGRLTFAQAQDRMKKYIVAAYKITPVTPTLVEARDAVLAAMFANDVNDFNVCTATFASRGAGFQAKPPTDRFSTTNAGVVESFVVTGSDLSITSSTLDTRSALFCDADPYLDNGETAKLSVTVKNTGLQALTGAQLTITSATAGVSFPDGPTVLLGTIQPFASQTVSVTVALTGAPSISTAALTATVTHPSVLTPVAPLTITVKVQRDDVLNASASDDVESGAPAWTTSLQGTTSASIAWRRVEIAPTDHRWSGPGGEVAGIAWLTSPPLVVAPTGTFSVSYSTRFSFEFDASINYDGGVIEVSQDNGVTWTDIETIVPGTYNGVIGTYAGDLNPAAGRPGFVQQSAGYPALATKVITFPASYLGKTVLIRFGSSSDSGVTTGGWDIDNIVVAGITNTPFSVLSGNAGTCATVSAAAGNAQSATVSSAFATALKAQVLSGSAPVAGVSVTFTAPASGASGTFPGSATSATVVTDASGYATAPTFTANATVGAFQVTATAGLNTGSFNLTNTVAIDTTPDAFTFTDQLNVQPGAVVTSNTITITGINAPATVAITGGSYSIGCGGTFSSQPGMITNGQTLCVVHTAPLALAATTNTLVSIGGVSDTFSSTTVASLNPALDTDGDGIPNGVELVEGRNPLAKDNDVFTNNRLFAMQQYRDFLGREGDAAGITGWINSLNSGGTRAAVTEGFFGSNEFQGTGSPVARLYFAYFLRIPDYGGLTFWTNYFRAGNPLSAISDAFAASPEFTSRYGTLNNSQFVDLVYQNVLGRAADAGGKTFWLGQLNGGMSRGTMMTGFSESPEFKAGIFNETYVTMMYVGMLKREPDSGGFTFWVGYLDAGASGQALINGFLGAPEYRSRFLP